MAVWTLLIREVGLLVEADLLAVLVDFFVLLKVAGDAVFIRGAVARLAVHVALVALHVVWGEEARKADLLAFSKLQLVAFTAGAALVFRRPVARPAADATPKTLRWVAEVRERTKGAPGSCDRPHDVIS